MRRAVPLVFGLVLLLSFATPTHAASTFVRHLIRTSVWAPPSPDPTGLDFLPSGQLLVTDSEVDEAPRSGSRNVWRIKRGGQVQRSMSTYKFSHEPTDVAVDGVKGLWYFADDVASGGRIFVVRLGPDKVYGTRDDRRRSFTTTGFGASDPEGLAYGGGALWISDGTSGKVFRIEPGPNGVIDGVDGIESRDLLGLGGHDLEGIEYAPNGNLFVLPNKKNANILEIEWAGGTLVKEYDLSLAHLVSPSAIAYGPSSVNPAKKSFYIADRGLDNTSAHPMENDGRIVELGVARRPLNLIRNGSFELDRNGDHRPDNWTFNSHFSRTTLVHRVGSYAGRHQGVGESSYTVRQDLADVVGGETYHFVGWTKIPTADAFTYRVRILWYGGNGAQLGRSQLDVFTSSTLWHQTDHNVTAPPGTVRGKFVMSVTGLSGRIYVDGFSLTVVS